MADYTFFFHPHSRAQIVRWALREVGADYEPVLVNRDNRPRQLLKANPPGKLPTIIHHTRRGDRVVTEPPRSATTSPTRNAPTCSRATTRRPTTSAGCSSPQGRERRR